MKKINNKFKGIIKRLKGKLIKIEDKKTILYSSS
jgi:hypothetical protein